MDKIRWHGRGGAGVVTAARLLGSGVALYEGKYAQSFPTFGPERRGAPVTSFTKISSQPIRDRSMIKDPNYVVVLDSSLMNNIDVFSGLKELGVLIINSPKPPSHFTPLEGITVITIDATGIALEKLGVPIVNTSMLGAVASTGLIQLDNLLMMIEEEFKGIGRGRENIEAAEFAYQQVKKGERR